MDFGPFFDYFQVQGARRQDSGRKVGLGSRIHDRNASFRAQANTYLQGYWLLGQRLLIANCSFSQLVAFASDGFPAVTIPTWGVYDPYKSNMPKSAHPKP